MYCIQENNYKATAVYVITTYFAQNNNNNNNNDDNNNSNNNNNNNNSNSSNNDNNNNNIIIIIIIIIMGWCPAGDSLISWGEGLSLALVDDNPSRDGFAIKMLVWRHLKPDRQLLWVNYV